jgi:hypothetical protein
LACQHLKHDHADQVHIGTLIGVAASEDFRRQISRRADQRTLLRPLAHNRLGETEVD